MPFKHGFTVCLRIKTLQLFALRMKVAVGCRLEWRLLFLRRNACVRKLLISEKSGKTVTAVFRAFLYCLQPVCFTLFLCSSFFAQSSWVKRQHKKSQAVVLRIWKQAAFWLVTIFSMKWNLSPAADRFGATLKAAVVCPAQDLSSGKQFWGLLFHRNHDYFFIYCFWDWLPSRTE